MKLYLVRHGEALHEARDSRRPLSSAGREGIQELGAYLNACGASPDRIWYSTKLRARETAEIIADRLGKEEVLEERQGLKPDDAVDLMLAEVENFRGKELMLVGHLPYMQIIAMTLLNDGYNVRGISFSPGKTFCLEKNVDGSWDVAYESPDLI